ncbi:unnamed protein product [Ceutorhynchus assimilis]|uniref:SprT-like domain-containing protein n=1 Tax=Ceutorhynchus assimilis TaxID=467358 RepID=A0A9N9QP61_9CUCU|nr:unnamed protein product [Ceutorhynchus assimilis]
MDESFDLLCSMSPKIRGRQETCNINHVSRLALRKHFRRSLIFDKSFRKEDLAIAEVDTESSESVSSFKESRDSNDFVIIDSDDDSRAKPQNREPKNTRIQEWLNDIDDDKEAETFYSQVSTIFGDESQKINHIAACSSFNDNNLNPRFDELFINKKKQCQQINESSQFSLHSYVMDSFEENKTPDDILITDNKKKIMHKKKRNLHSALLDSLGKNKSSSEDPITDKKNHSIQVDQPSVESPFSLHLDLLDSSETNNNSSGDGMTSKKKHSIQKDRPSVESPFSLHLGLLDSSETNDNSSGDSVTGKKKHSIQKDRLSAESPFSLHLGLLDSLDKNETAHDDNGPQQILDNNKKAVQLNKHRGLLDNCNIQKTAKVIIDDSRFDEEKKIEELNESSFSLGLGLSDNLETKLEKNRSQIVNKTESLKLDDSPSSVGLGPKDSLENSKNHINKEKSKQKLQLDELSSLPLGFGRRDSLEKQKSIIIIDDTIDNIETPKKSPEVLPRDTFVSVRKKNKITEVVPKTPDLSIKEASSILDSIYGKKWRTNKDEVLLSLSEPKKKQPKPKNMEKKVEAPKTERVLKPKIKGNLLPSKKLNFERLKKPVVESPWAKRLEGLVDSESSSEENNLKKLTDIKPSKVRLNFNDSPIPIRKPLSSIRNKENNPQNTKKRNIKKASSSSTSFSDDDYQVSTDEEYDKEIRILETKRKSLMPQKQTKYSFLESLSGSVPLNKCDMSARIFRSNFKQHRQELATRLFKLFNEKVFGNALLPDTELEWNDKLRKTAGLCYCKKITHKNKTVERKVRIALSTKVLDSTDRLRDTLVHEMCHAVTWIVNEVSDGHGAYWKSWAFKAMNVFPELPAISRCHNYAINSKYTYRCTKCGYSFGRHSKSLDVERKRCGHCYGKFEVLINKTTKNGETKAVLVGEKKTTGFALFVKENYAKFKDPSKKHGDVMKILGQKFAELKVKN